jgi:hypothetical protein
MTANEVKWLSQLVGKKVRTLCSWSGVEIGTIGLVDEMYTLGGGDGVMVAWCLPGEETEFENYRMRFHLIFPGRGYPAKGVLRDGFGRDELKFLEILE